MLLRAQRALLAPKAKCLCLWPRRRSTKCGAPTTPSDSEDLWLSPQGEVLSERGSAAPERMPLTTIIADRFHTYAQRRSALGRGTEHRILGSMGASDLPEWRSS